MTNDEDKPPTKGRIGGTLDDFMREQGILEETQALAIAEVRAWQAAAGPDPSGGWNYRIVQRRDGSFSLHEVYYHGDGNPRAMTETPITFVVDAEEGPPGIVASLEVALRDARERPVLIEAKAFSERP